MRSRRIREKKMSQIRRIKDMRLAKKETAVVTSPIKKVTLVDKEEVCLIICIEVGHKKKMQTKNFRESFRIVVQV